MILVVSPNLAVDVTLDVERLEPGAVHRALRTRRQAGGKGVNFARALTSLGAQGLPEDPPRVLGFAGGRAGEAIREGLESEGIASDLIPFPGESRACTILLDRTGVATVVNEPGPAIEDPLPLLSRFEERLGGARAVAFMGSLNPGLPLDLYASMIALARKRKRICLLDSSGPPLERALASGPSIAKPNRAEAEALLGRELSTDAARRGGVQRLRELGAETAVITFGAEGFLVASASGIHRCASNEPSDMRLGNPTGAGDALAAGLLAGAVRGYPLVEMARLAAAAATASLAEGYGRFRTRDIRIEACRVEKLLCDRREEA
jgi:tagatose 6-phosphate kinase